ncbi:MAG: alkaline phosphatase family protein [Actinomycetales bacterium]
MIAEADTAVCGSLADSYDPATPPAYDHIIVIMDENLSYATWLTPNLKTQMPYTHSISAACGSEGYMHAATHPSVNNYAAATSGLGADYSGSDNIFHQSDVPGSSWVNYAESESTPCQQRHVDPYKTGHVPAFQYSDIRRTTCPLFQLPMDARFDSAVESDSLPAYTWISPNECHGTYWVSGCPGTKANRYVAGDAWLQGLLPRLFAMPSYAGGRTLIILTWDEGNKTVPHGVDCADPAVYAIDGNSCAIPTIVMSAYIRPGMLDTSDQNTYSLLGTTEDMLGFPRLNQAATYPQSLRPGLGF